MVPALLEDVAKLTWQITNLSPKLALCSTVEGVITFNEGSQFVFEKVKECVKAKKEHAELHRKCE